jgi:hypothetical protein
MSVSGGDADIQHSDDVAYGSRLCENSREQSARRIVFSLFFSQLSASELSFPIKDIRDKLSTRKSDVGVFTQSGSHSRRFDPQPVTSGLPQSTDIARPARLVRFVPEPDLICPSSLIRERCDTSCQTIQASGSPTADASDAYSKHIHELGPTLLSMTLSR